MANNLASGSSSRPNGDHTPALPSCGDRLRYLSESEAGPPAKSLARLCSRDEDERAAALEELSQGVLACLGPERPDRAAPAGPSRETLLHLLRLSRSCPLQEIRGRAAELLRKAKVSLEATLKLFPLPASCPAEQGLNEKNMTHPTVMRRILPIHVDHNDAFTSGPVTCLFN